MKPSEIRDQLGSLCRLMEEEAASYQALVPLLRKQRQAAVEVHFEPFIASMGEKNTLLDKLRNLESKRLQLINDLSKALGEPAQQLTVSRLIALSPGPQADQLNASRFRLQAVIEQVREDNDTNENLLRHLRELLKKSVNVLAGNAPEEQTYRENGQVKETRPAGAAVQGHISFEV